MAADVCRARNEYLLDEEDKLNNDLLSSFGQSWITKISRRTESCQIGDDAAEYPAGMIGS